MNRFGPWNDISYENVHWIRRVALDAANPILYITL